MYIIGSDVLNGIASGTIAFSGIPATGLKVRVEGMNFYRLKDGRVTDIWTQSDVLGMLRQLGAIAS